MSFEIYPFRIICVAIYHPHSIAELWDVMFIVFKFCFLNSCCPACAGSSVHWPLSPHLGSSAPIAVLAEMLFTTLLVRLFRPWSPLSTSVFLSHFFTYFPFLIPPLEVPPLTPSPPPPILLNQRTSLVSILIRKINLSSFGSTNLLKSLLAELQGS